FCGSGGPDDEPGHAASRIPGRYETSDAVVQGLVVHELPARAHDEILYLGGARIGGAAQDVGERATLYEWLDGVRPEVGAHGAGIGAQDVDERDRLAGRRRA